MTNGDHAKVNIMVNGDPMEVSEPYTVENVLIQRGHDLHLKLAVAVNQSFVARKDFASTFIAHGDEVEIVAPMVGG